MKTTKNRQGNKFQISLETEYSMEDLKEWDILVMNVLLLLKGHKTSLITIGPQSYSIGYELGDHQKLKRGKKDYLINWDIALSDDIFHLITESEEFKRGLLFFVLSENIKDIFETIDAIDSVGSIDFSRLEVEIIVLEDDGETITWNFPSNEIQTYLLNI